MWNGSSTADRIARAALAPFEAAYRGVSSIRNSLYDSGVLKTEASPVPVVSVGNLTVGGTGKTPMTAWIAHELAKSKKTPAIVLRGYGDDEPLVHQRCNPDVPVIVSPDRVAGIREAAAAGAGVVVLDDGFQHRTAARSLDIVLISADQWRGTPRLLPAGPFRESLSGLKRASLIVITRKAAPDAQVALVERALRDTRPSAPIVVARLELKELVREQDKSDAIAVEALAGKSVFAIAAVGNPDAFFAQLRAYTPRLIATAFPDHHAFTDREIAELARRGRESEYVVCTLKDAVKLGPRWPADASPLWYVSLAVRIERGAESIRDLLSRL